MKMASRLIDLISKKTNCTCSTLFFLISKKKIKEITRYFYEGIVLCAYPRFCLLCSCSLIFFTASHFHLAAAPCWPLAFLIVSPSL